MDASFSTADQAAMPPGTSVPGGVYLCQVGEAISCGACCGLYNVADASREALAAMLARRTERFSRIPRDMDAILAFAERTEAEECQRRPYPDFHHCPYIGLIGEGGTRVGCLLHPLAAGNNGVDFRGLSYYGGMACRIYFCPATHRLATRYKAVLRLCFDHWYDYGLIVTERHLVAALFGAVEQRLGQTLDADTIARRPDHAAALAELLGIKREWPFRHRQKGHLCHNLFQDDGHGRAPKGAPAGNGGNGFYDIVFQEVASALDTPEQIAAACAEVDRRLDLAVRALGGWPFHSAAAPRGAARSQAPGRPFQMVHRSCEAEKISHSR